jgi:hypothetical protein
MKLKLIGVVISLLLLTVVVATVGAHGRGNSPGHLGDRGWACENLPGLGVHCFPPGSSASSASITVKVFDTINPEAEHAPFAGTEILIRADLYHDQPCPQDNLSLYHPLDIFPPPPDNDGVIDYYACHFYDTSS